jgi:dihydrofolate synthase/folylpolyglutamate synthase
MEDALTAILKECEDANQGLPITFFEITTVAGILAFARHPADALVLEVGLGGRFDATNVIDRPAVTLVTPVSYDHQQYLGDTIEAIAGEKAGILKPGVTGIIGPQTDAARAVIETAAARAGAPLLIQDQDFQAYEEHGRLVYQDGQGLLDLPLPRLAGRHQVANAGTAIAALRATGWDIGEAAYATGMRNAAMPARLQRLTRGPLVAEAEAARGVNAPAADIWLDGGHNPAAGQVLAQALADLEERDPRPLHLIVGMLNTKDPAGFLAPFAGLARGAIAVPIRFSDAGLPPNAVAEAGARAGLATTTAETAGAAFTRILSESGETPPRVLICGSLYLAGEILAEHG